MAGLADLAQQIFNLDQALQTAASRIETLETELQEVNSRGGREQNKQSIIMDGKKLYPEHLKDMKKFVRWSESFLR